MRAGFFPSRCAALGLVLAALAACAPTRPNETARSGQRKQLCQTAISPDGITAAIGDDDGNIRIWDIDTGEDLCVFSGHSKSVLSVTFSPDGKVLASHSNDETIRLWSVATGKELHQIICKACQTAEPVGISFSLNGELNLFWSDQCISIWDVADLLKDRK
jgi:WD40 repeat protein